MKRDRRAEPDWLEERPVGKKKPDGAKGANFNQIAIGLLLVASVCWVGSWLAPSLVGPEQAWTDGDEKEFREAFSKVHAHDHGDGGDGDGGSHDQNADTTNKQKLQQLQKKLDAARSRGSGAASIARGAGIAFGLLGIAVYMVGRAS